MTQYEHQELTGKIIAAAHCVHGVLGGGFLEKVYHNALMIELGKNDIEFESQKRMEVLYDMRIVGEFFADLVVEDKVVVEIKAVDQYNNVFEAQLLNYLKASGLKVGLILNFGRSVHVKRMVL